MVDYKARILVVDDESDALIALFDFLSAQGYFVEGSSSASDALDYLRRRAYDVVLADMHLPEMEGLELLDRIRNISARTRVILLGSGDDEGTRDDALRKGSDGFLIKPFDREELLRNLGGLTPGSATQGIPSHGVGLGGLA